MAPSADTISRKLLSLNDALRELARPAASDAKALMADSMLRAAVERWLQVAIEACVDIATHVIGDEGWTPPGNARASFQILAGHNLITADLAKRLALAASLRNLLVHDYATVDLERLAATVRDDLGDLRQFAGLASAWMSSG
jgi:uncharacterized protein YutE (UPF0331/DUF86 family)